MLAPGSKEFLFVQENCLVVTEIHFKPFMKFRVISQEMCAGSRKNGEHKPGPSLLLEGKKINMGRGIRAVSIPLMRTNICITHHLFLRGFYLYPLLLPNCTGINLTMNATLANRNMNLSLCILHVIPACIWLATGIVAWLELLVRNRMLFPVSTSMLGTK